MILTFPFGFGSFVVTLIGNSVNDVKDSIFERVKCPAAARFDMPVKLFVPGVCSAK